MVVETRSYHKDSPGGITWMSDTEGCYIVISDVQLIHIKNLKLFGLHNIRHQLKPLREPVA